MAVQVLDGNEVIGSDPLLHPSVLPHHISSGLCGDDFYCHSAQKQVRLVKKTSVMNLTVLLPFRCTNAFIIFFFITEGSKQEVVTYLT